MALSHIVELDNKLKDEIFPSVFKLSENFQNETKNSCYLPEVIEEFLGLLHEIDSYVGLLSKALFSALHSVKDFKAIYKSQKLLISELKRVLVRIKDEEPDSALISQYSDALEKNLLKFKLLDEIRVKLNYPRSKKRLKIWKKKGWLNENFEPFNHIESLKNNFNSKLEELTNES